MLSPSIEDYLKALYELSERGGPAQTGLLAKRLGVSPASVTGMLRRLSAQKPSLVVYRRHHGAELSPEGRQRAMEIIRHHRLIETFLHQTLAVPWDQVHVEAERLEHSLSEALEDRLAEQLGDPAVDPHGALIPRKDGSLPKRDEVSLALLPAGSSGRIAQVADEDAELLRHLDDLGLRPGNRVTVLAFEPFDGPIRIQIEGQPGDRTIGLRVAQAVTIERPGN